MRYRNRHKLDNFLTYQDAKNLLCLECTHTVSTGGRSQVSKQISKTAQYKTLCKSHKCGVHKNKRKVGKGAGEKLIEPKVFQRITYGKKCRVTEFEEQEEHETVISPAMLNTVDGMVEEIGWEDIKFEKYLSQTFVKDAVTRTVIWPLNKPKVFKGLRSAPRGVLLFGPSGSGKTIIGKHIAFQTEATFFNLPASVLTSEWAENSRDFVKTVFLIAKARQPSVIFIDEVDTLFSHKALLNSEFNRKIKTELLLCMDAVDRNSDERILIVGATKKPFDLDNEVILKFSKRFYVSLPDKTARKGLLEKLLENECHSLEYTDIEEICNKTEGYSVAEIKQLCQEAAMCSMMSFPTEHFDQLELSVIKPISCEDFIFALRMIKPTLSKEELHLYESWDFEYGYGGQLTRKSGNWNGEESNLLEQQSSYIT